MKKTNLIEKVYKAESNEKYYKGRFKEAKKENRFLKKKFKSLKKNLDSMKTKTRPLLCFRFIQNLL